jgi:hypothetical protein
MDVFDVAMQKRAASTMRIRGQKNVTPGIGA